MLVAHLSDCHITEPGGKAHGVVATAEHLRACVDHINAMLPRPDVTLVTGDITYSGTEEEAFHAATILNRLQMPFYLVPGNHDRRETLWQVFGGRAIPDRQDETLSYCLERFPVRLIGLDTVTPGGPGGSWMREQNDWLERCLSGKPDIPTILFLHHPPLKFRVPETDQDGFSGAGRLGDLVARFDNILALVCGHIHLQAHAPWQGTVVSTAPSAGLHLALDLTLRKPSRFIPDMAGFQLHYISAKGRLVSHSVMLFGQYQTFPFDESSWSTPTA